MECPLCRSDIDQSAVDVCYEEGPWVGLEVYAPCCKKLLRAEVQPEAFHEVTE